MYGRLDTVSSKQQEQWTSKLGVIFAVAGGAIGLGNFLRFPGLAAQYGGGAFMVAYVISLLVLGIPVGWAEWSLGRRGGLLGSNCGPGIFWKLTHGSTLWKMLGVLPVLGPTAVAFYYIPIEAWCFGYMCQLAEGTSSFETATQTQSFFNDFVGISAHGAAFSGGSLLIVSLLVSVVLNLWIVYRGISQGVERFCRWSIPVLLVISIILLLRVLTIGTPDPMYPERNVEEGLGYMWNPNKVLLEERIDNAGGGEEWQVISMAPINRPDAMDALKKQVEESDGQLRLTEMTLWQGLKNIELWLAAAGQVFLSLSVGVGLILTYASYLRKKDDVALSALTAVAANETCEVTIAGMMTIPAAVAFFGVAGAAGQGTFALGFMTLPQVFAKMHMGGLFGFLFFLLLFAAAVTSSISMMQVGLSFFEEFMGIGRRLAVVVLGFFTCCGAAIVVWFSEGLIALDCFDFWIGTMCFFLSAMVVMLLFAWKLNIKRGIVDLNKNSQIRIPKIYIWCMKYLTPTALVALFLGWLVQNIWSQQAPPLKALLELKTGAVVPVITILAYFVFLQFITVASNRHKKRAKRAKRLKKGTSE